jgi:hypothetical protein
MPDELGLTREALAADDGFNMMHRLKACFENLLL